MYLKVKEDKYYPLMVNGLYRTEDGHKLLYFTQSCNPIVLSSDTSIHINARLTHADVALENDIEPIQK